VTISPALLSIAEQALSGIGQPDARFGAEGAFSGAARWHDDCSEARVGWR
jgi:hypothetical protein